MINLWLWLQDYTIINNIGGNREGEVMGRVRGKIPEPMESYKWKIKIKLKKKFKTETWLLKLLIHKVLLEPIIADVTVNG